MREAPKGSCTSAPGLLSEYAFTSLLGMKPISTKSGLEPDNVDRLIPLGEFAYYWNKARYPRRFENGISPSGLEAGISRQFDRGTETHVQRHLDSWRLYHFHDTGFDSPMKKTADVNDNRYLRPDGSNLAPFLYLLQENHSDSYNLIVGTVRQAAPFFRDFRLEPQLLNPDKMRLEWLHEGTDAYFDSSSLSDGTLRFIALASLFLQPLAYRPSVIMVDEPGTGYAPLRHYPAGVAHEVCFNGSAGCSIHPVVSSAGPL